MKKKNKVNYMRIFGLIFIIFMVFQISSQFYQLFVSKYNISNAQKENDKLKKEKEKLNNEIIKLKDKNYIQSYISGTIFSTEKGTTVYVLPEGTPE